MLTALAIGWLWTTSLLAQNVSLKAMLSHDTVSVQELLTVTFELKNAKGKIEPPEFIGFQLVSGPNIITQMQIIQGNMTQSYAVSYVLKPQDLGTFVIEKAQVSLEDGTYLESDPLIIVVSAQRSVKKQGFKQNNRFDFPLENPFFESPPAPAKPSPQDSIQERLKKVPRKKF